MTRLALYLAKPLVWFIGNLPFRIQWFVGDLLGILWFDIFRIRRQVVLNNLCIAFPEMSQKERVKLGRRSCQNLGRNLMEYTQIPFLSPEKISSKIIVNDSVHLEEALKKGRGVCLLTLHMGNGDFAVTALALQGFPFTVVSKEFKVKWLNELWFGMRKKSGVEFSPPRNSTYSILKALKKNRIVGFVLDQFTGPPIGVRTKFFGRETGTAMGMAVIARRSQAPVVPSYTYRREDGKTVIQWLPEVKFEKKEDKDEEVAHMTQVYTDILEKIVREHPEQWMWIHRRWKEFRD